MTATLPPRGQPSPPRGASGPPQRAASGPPPRADSDPSLGVRRTALALVGAGLGIVPLKALFSDWIWLPEAWLTMLVVAGPALLLRRRRPPGALDIWPGIVLLVPWLTLLFVRGHAIGGIIPTPASWGDVSRLLTDLHHTSQDSAAPIHTTVAVRLVICSLIGLLAALVDLVAVVGHRGALAGVPLLVVYTVAGAVPRRPVPWVWFIFAALGYLVLLALDSGEDLRSWGRRIRPAARPAATGSGAQPPGRAHRRGAFAVSTPRIVVAAVVAAVVLPMLVPGQSRNLVANLFHGGGNGNGVGSFGAGSGGTLSPFANLKGQLNRDKPLPLLTVHMIASGKTQPFYLRTNVLASYNGNGWSLANHGTEESLDTTGYGTEPNDSTGDTESMTARISSISSFANAPVFSVPSNIDGLDTGDTTWSLQDQLLLGHALDEGNSYVESFRQPTPSLDELRAATDAPPSQLADLLRLPSNLPAFVRRRVTQITAGAQSPYDRARALSDYFTNPRNGFVYALKTDPGDSGSELVDFLQNKQGFCQQYAAAMGVMLRAAGIPSRVVLGYMHTVPDAKGNFTVSTSEAHAWDEAYFSGIGWVPFDPTPAAGLAGGAQSDLAWAPHTYPSTASGPDVPTAGRSSAAVVPTPTPSTTSPAGVSSATASDGTSLTPVWWLLGLVGVLLVAATPASARILRRRRRITSGRRTGDADALWAELSDTAVDLGYDWSAARSPRQVAEWLPREAGVSAPAVRELAAAVERDRYAAPGVRSDDDTAPAGRLLAERLRTVLGELRAHRSRGARLRAVLWPASQRRGGRGTGTAGLRWHRPRWHGARLGGDVTR